MPITLKLALGALAATLAIGTLAGCGLVAHRAGAKVTVTLTEDFGAVRLAASSLLTASGSETVLHLLERKFPVTTRYRGGPVQSIDGRTAGAHRRWYLFVNGVEAHSPAANTSVHAGDRIWWDLRDGRAGGSVPAVVGAFPEPFLNGIAGRRYPTTLECAADAGAACRRVAATLARAGVPAAAQFFGTGSGTASLNVLVATWKSVRSALIADVLEHGPSVSGVYARFGGSDDDQLEVMNAGGQVIRRLGPDAGLIAATADISGTPTWLITGTDPAGVAAAAAALEPARLRDHYALAVAGGADMPVPLTPAG